MKIDFLRMLTLFEGLSTEELKKISNIVVSKSFKKGEVLLFEGDLGRSLYIIKSGKVKISSLSEDGREKIFSIFTDGDFFGEMAMLSDEGLRSANVEALSDTETYIIHKDDFMIKFKENFEITMKIIHTLIERVKSLNKKIEILTFSDVHARFADVVLDMMDKHGRVKEGKVYIDLSLTHKELANMLGVTRETITRIIGKLKKEKIIDIQNKKIIILDEDKLKNLLDATS